MTWDGKQLNFSRALLEVWELISDTERGLKKCSEAVQLFIQTLFDIFLQPLHGGTRKVSSKAEANQLHRPWLLPGARMIAKYLGF